MATIAQIASQLKLNKSTVSRALNNRAEGVSEETRQHIKRVAQEMGYVPNPVARALTSAHSGNIGLVSRKFHNSLYTSLLQEIAIAVDERSGNLVSCITGRDTTHHGQGHLLHPGAVDGILAFPYALPGLDLPDSPWMRRPIIFLLSVWDEEKAPSVRFDDRDGAEQVASHLWDLDHRNLIYLQGIGPNNVLSTFGVERYAFLEEAWTARGGSIRQWADQATAEGGYRAMGEALVASAVKSADDNPSGATAVVAYSDQMALGALRMLTEHGIRVPEDLSLVGWNDLDDTGQFLSPALTSVRTSPYELAQAAVGMLFGHIQSRTSGSHDGMAAGVERLRVPVRLIVRESTRKVG